MSPYAMLALLVIAWSAFGWSAARRWKLMRAGAPLPRFDRIGERLAGTYRWAFKQERMNYYQPAGIAHKLIFVGFMVLLLRTLVLWGRGFSPTFNMFVLAPWTPAGRVYEFAKDSVATLVLGGTMVFFYYRLVKPLKRTTKSFEATLILAIIATMMIADMAYDGASHVLLMRKIEMCGMGKASLASAAQCDAIRTIVAPLGGHLDAASPAKIEWSPYPSPAGTLFGVFFRALSAGALVWIARIGFWTHSTLVLLFLNLLPHSKHFHVITAHPERLLPEPRPAGPAASDRGDRRRRDGEAPGGDGQGPRRSHGSRDRSRARGAFVVEGDPRLLHVHRVRPLLGQLPGAPHRQDPEPEAPHARPPQPPLRA